MRLAISTSFLNLGFSSSDVIWMMCLKGFRSLMLLPGVRIFVLACVCHNHAEEKQERGDIPPACASISSVPPLTRSRSLVLQSTQGAASSQLLPLLSHNLTHTYTLASCQSNNLTCFFPRKCSHLINMYRYMYICLYKF